MLRDAQGLEVTTNFPEAVAAIDQFIEQSLRYGSNPEVILQGIEADPTCALANAHAAAHYLSLESAEARRQALPYLAAAKQYLAAANEREQLYVQAIAAWASGAIDQAITYHEAIALAFPRDLLSVQRGQYHYFYQGNQARLLQIAETVLPANPDNHYLQGMLAFGLEQCHRLEEAEVAGRQATAINRYDPWAHHAVAHVMETQGRLEEGIAWMESLADTWEHCNSMLYTHNWWHVALYYLEQGKTAQVLTLYDTHIWGRACKASSKDQVGAISLLLRLELQGVEVGARWQRLGNYVIARIHEHALPFQDLHYVYALARAGQAELLTEMLSSMQAYAKTTNSYTQQTWAEIAIPAARGMAAHAIADWPTVVAILGSILPQLHRIGGSHAQRDLFEQVYLDAWLRADRNYEAVHLLQKRAAARRFIPSLPQRLAWADSNPKLALKVS